MEYSPAFAPEHRPASAFFEDFESRAKVHQTLASERRGSGKFEDDKALYEKTLEERDSGHLVGPFSAHELTRLFGPNWSPNPRFGVFQKGKRRPIDDYSAFGSNALTEIFFKVESGGVDEIVALAKCFHDAIPPDGSVVVTLSTGEELRGKLAADLDGARPWTSSVSASTSRRPTGSCPSRRTTCRTASSPSGTLTGGASSSFRCTPCVYCFNRAARALQYILVNLLIVPFSNCVDDYPMVEPSALAGDGFQSVVALLKLLGWDISTDDLEVPPKKTFEVLGVVVDFSHLAGLGKLIVRNKESRIDGLVETIDRILSDKRWEAPIRYRSVLREVWGSGLSRPWAERLRALAGHHRRCQNRPGVVPILPHQRKT